MSTSVEVETCHHPNYFFELKQNFSQPLASSRDDSAVLEEMEETCITFMPIWLTPLFLGDNTEAKSNGHPDLTTFIILSLISILFATFTLTLFVQWVVSRRQSKSTFPKNSCHSVQSIVAKTASEIILNTPMKTTIKTRNGLTYGNATTTLTFYNDDIMEVRNEVQINSDKEKFISKLANVIWRKLKIFLKFFCESKKLERRKSMASLFQLEMKKDKETQAILSDLSFKHELSLRLHEKNLNNQNPNLVPAPVENLCQDINTDTEHDSLSIVMQKYMDEEFEDEQRKERNNIETNESENRNDEQESTSDSELTYNMSDQQSPPSVKSFGSTSTSIDFVDTMDNTHQSLTSEVSEKCIEDVQDTFTPPLETDGMLRKYEQIQSPELFDNLDDADEDILVIHAEGTIQRFEEELHSATLRTRLVESEPESPSSAYTTPSIQSDFPNSPSTSMSDVPMHLSSMQLSPFSPTKSLESDSEYLADSPPNIDQWNTFLDRGERPDAIIKGSDNEDQEDLNDYCTGGYHPVKLGDVYNARYLVLQKLGWGQFSTVWFCKDTIAEPESTHAYVALKIMRSSKNYTETAVDEIKILKLLRLKNPDGIHSRNIVELLDDFRIQSVNGIHVCLVFELLGKNLYKLIITSKFQGLSIRTVKMVLRQLLQTIHFMHVTCQVIHTDIKPENILKIISQENIRSLAAEATKNLPLGKSKNSATLKHRVQADNNGEVELPKKKLKNDSMETKLGYVGCETELKRFLATSKVVEGTSPKKSDSLVNPPFSTPMNTSAPQIYTSDPSDEVELVLIGEMEDSNPGPSSGCTGPDKFPSNFEDIEEDVNVKLVDLGNACFIDNHYTDQIQTRQYRAIEVILDCGYGPEVDIWSLACVAFEIATGDYLFEPTESSRFSRGEDHLCQMIDLLGPIPQRIITAGKLSHEFFDSNGSFRHIPANKMKPWPMELVLTEKYDWMPENAAEFTNFLKPMLAYDPAERSTALQALNHPWLNS